VFAYEVEESSSPEGASSRFGVVAARRSHLGVRSRRDRR